EVEIVPGQLILVVGKVGSGKSTLLQALGSGISSKTTRILIPRDVKTAFVAQKPFLMGGSIKDNILFKKKSNALYDTVIEKCQLRPDLNRFAPDYDGTLVGAKGVQLSGGQKTRVSLARALYAEPELLFLDDVLSAVDATTGEKIWSECVWEPCVVEKKCAVVLATHQLHFLLES
ncbi:unnamed protein product, partial [Amoebophrya sp. A120]